MQMLTKFESKSSRAKGVAFHPKRPWILVSLYSSTIQLWDYRMGTIIDRFEGHEGPVRGVDFHKTQPLFVSCGDDYTVRVWSLQTRKCLFILKGHLDYVRTCFFHDDLPWIITASDDQTIRIWNWQNRQEIACLTGHNHYVMCAQFHPKDDLIVSASFDQTVRVWDISGLRKKHSAPSQSVSSFEDQLARANAPQQDIFGNTDAIVKFVLEGHDRGVNWAAFHPTSSLIVSAGDDRVLKLWRMSETKAYEVDTFRGHTHNVLCCLFHPYQDMIISVSEDKTIRTWDLTKRTAIQQFKRENDKFWQIVCHRGLNLFGAAHDGGVMVFKLERERPASAVYQNSIIYVNHEKQVKQFDIGSSAAGPSLLSLKKILSANPWIPFRTLSYNPAERSILVTAKTDNSNDGQCMYELISLPKDATGAIEPTGTQRGAGEAAVFITRSRFAVLKADQTINVMDLTNSVTKSVKSPINAKDMLYAGQGIVLLIGNSGVALFDVQQKKVLGEIPVAGIKYASWSNDGQYIALQAKHTITIVTKQLETVSSVHETIRIKSCTWDDSNVLLYSTLNHLKYCLLNGDNGILKTLQSTLYLMKVKGNNVYSLARGGSVELIRIDPTEYRFKKALVNKNFHEVLRLIKTSQLVGQSIIAYLQKKGYPEIALQFVQDAGTKFDLAIECGNLSVAFEQAKELDKPTAWQILGQEAVAQGNHDIVEDIYQKQRDFDKLAFIYLITGNISRLQKVEQIADHRNNSSERFQSSIYLNSVENRISLLKDGGLYPLAYSLAKSSGMNDIANEILEEAGMDENDVKVTIHDTSSDGVAGIAFPTYQKNWPLKSASLSFFEQALLGNMENLSLEDHEGEENGNLLNGDGGIVRDITSNGDHEEGEVDEGAWELDVEDLGFDDIEAAGGETGARVTSSIGAAETDLWLQSPVAADHVAAGSFETAAQLLNRQVGVVNFQPLKSRFLNVYQASKLYMTGNDGLPPLPYYIRRETEQDSRILPYVPGYDSLTTSLQEAYKAFRSNKLELAIENFREILYKVVVLAVPTEDEAEECLKVIDICKNYILALSIELKRRSLPASDIKRNLELAAYFTIPKLQAAHAVIPLQQAMNLSAKNKNIALSGYFAKKYLELNSSGSTAEIAKKIVSKASTSPLDAVDIEFDQFTEFDVCPSTFTPIYSGSPYKTDPLTGAKYHLSEDGKLCNITKITKIGMVGSGLKLYV